MARLGAVTYPACELDRRAEEVPVFGDWLSGVESDTDAEGGFTALFCVSGYRSLDLDGALEGLRGGW